MHRLPSETSILRLRIVSILLWLKYPLFASVIAVFITMLVTREQELLILAIATLLAFVVVWFAQAILATQTRCPLCLTPVLARKSCVKNKNAKTMLTSYRLRVAYNILTRNHFRCPYCNEPAELKVRERKPQNANPRD